MNSLYLRTPLLESLPLSSIVGRTIYLKMEALQPSGSFKNRGIGHLCLASVTQGKKSFVSSSGGNAGLAVAFSGRKLGIPVKVITPVTTPPLMQEKIHREGAEVIIHGASWDEADQLARHLSQDPSVGYIPPFDHPLIWEGNCTLVEEVAETGFKPDAVLLSVGGGGLYCGVVLGLQKLGWNDVPVITSETQGASSFNQSVVAGELITLDKIDTIATTLGAKRVAEQALRYSKTHPTFPQVVSDREALDACLRFADDHRILVEPSCGATLALIYQRIPLLEKYSSLLVIVCGGSGVSQTLLKQWRDKVESAEC